MYISDEFDSILKYAGEEALRSGYFVVGPDHLMLGILRHSDNEACRLLKSAGIKPDVLKAEIDNAISIGNRIADGCDHAVEITIAAQELINQAMMTASLQGVNEVRSIHLLLALSKGPDCFSKMKLSAINLDRPVRRHVRTQSFIVRKNKVFS